jgi:hypothetical protein
VGHGPASVLFLSQGPRRHPSSGRSDRDVSVVPRSARLGTSTRTALRRSPVLVRRHRDRR